MISRVEDGKVAGKQSLWVLILGLLVLALAIPIGGVQAAQPGERLGDWFYNCDVGANSTKGPCYISQTSEKEINKEMVRMVTANIGYLFDDKKIWLVTLLPLRTWHLDMQKSVNIDVDGNKLIAGKVDTCFVSGCRARFALDRNILTSFIKGKAAGLSFTLITGKPIRLELSLNGIAKALRTL